MHSEKSTEPKPAGSRPQRLAYYHPNGQGTGVAMQLEPRFNRLESDRYNCFFLEMARQKTTVANGADGRVAATFDWENKLTVKLDFSDICELLSALEGLTPAAGNKGKGLYHENGKANTIITLERNKEKTGFFLGLSKKDKQGGQLLRLSIALSDPEALGLRCIFQSGLFFLVFHGQLFPSPARHAMQAKAAEAGG
jgi:hypothetical protein